MADTYVAAFLAPKVAAKREQIPLSGHLWGMLHPRPGQPARTDLAEASHELCRAHRVFHWWLAFPQIAVKGGFAVMLGNPPWEVSQLGEEEFFASRAPSVAALAGEQRKRAIAGLESQSPWLWQQFQDTKRGYEAVNLFFRGSGRYPLTAIGKLNTYRLFAEAIYQLVDVKGRAGFIVPTGIATDDTSKDFFATVASGRLISLHDLRTGPGLFSEIGHQRFKFCLLTLGTSPSADFLFFALSVEDLANPLAHFRLTPEDFRLINPNTLTCPVFRSQRDAELTKKLYRASPVLIREAVVEGEGAEARIVQPERNPWGISFSQGLFNMTSDSGLFRDTHAGFSEVPSLPLYEAKMIHQFDHRWATYVDAPDKPAGLDTVDVDDAQKAESGFTVRPRYWVDQRQVLARIARVPLRVANAWLALHTAYDAAGTKPARDAPDGSTNAVQTALTDAQQAFTLAVAGWVGAALFARTADAAPVGARAGSTVSHAATAGLFDEPATPQSDGSVPSGTATAQVPCLDLSASRWTNHQRQAAIAASGQALTRRFPFLGRVLTSAYPKSTKLLEMLEKWAVQDEPAQGLSLSDAELDTFAAWAAARQPVVSPEDTPENIANNDTSTMESGQLLLKIVDESLERRSPRWLMGWRNIARSTDERSFIASVMPRLAIGHSMPLWMVIGSCSKAAVLLGNLVALVFDYVVRQKLGGTNMTFGYVKQFPVLPPDRYTDDDLAFIVPRVLELTYTAHDLKPWADDLITDMPAADPRPAPDHGQPFPWNPERRAHLRAELDAYYARLYGLTRDELRYILDPADVMGPDYPSETFRVLKNNEMREFAEYRTRRLVLAAWDALED